MKIRDTEYKPESISKIAMYPGTGFTLYFDDAEQGKQGGVDPSDEGYRELQKLLHERSGGMTEMERKCLIRHFQDVQAHIEKIQGVVKMAERAYPGLAIEHMFVGISNGLYTAREQAEALADYIAVGTDEHWEQEP